jgi:hypothetical protein
LKVPVQPPKTFSVKRGLLALAAIWLVFTMGENYANRTGTPTTWICMQEPGGGEVHWAPLESAPQAFNNLVGTFCGYSQHGIPYEPPINAPRPK